MRTLTHFLELPPPPHQYAAALAVTSCHESHRRFARPALPTPANGLSLAMTPCHGNAPRSSRPPPSESRGGSRGCDTMSRVPRSTASTRVAFAGRTTALAVTPCHKGVLLLAPPSRPPPGAAFVLAVTPCHEHRFPTPRPDGPRQGAHWLAGEPGLTALALTSCHETVLPFLNLLHPPSVVRACRCDTVSWNRIPTSRTTLSVPGVPASCP
jgi:hypothetical protein